jgi:hypothetical protein
MTILTNCKKKTYFLTEKNKEKLAEWAILGIFAFRGGGGWSFVISRLVMKKIVSVFESLPEP